MNPSHPLLKSVRLKKQKKADLLIIIGTNAEVLPAAEIPVVAKEHGAKIIEINIEETHFTGETTDIFLHGKASEIMKALGELLYL